MKTLAQGNTNANFDLQLFADEPAAAEPAATPEPAAAEPTPADPVTPEATPAEPTKAEPAAKPAAADALADYKPTMPEGFAVNEALMGEFLPTAKELGLNPEQADKLVGMGAKVAQETAQKVAQDINAQCEKGYADFIAAQKGPDFERDLGNTNALIEKYGGAEAKESMHAALTALSGFSPDAVGPLFNALIAMGKDYADPSFHLGAPAPSGKNTYYPDLPQNNKGR